MNNKRYILTFPDGLAIPDFQWSILGWYRRPFPDSGIHSQQLNDLLFTPKAAENAGIEVLEAVSLEGSPQFAAVHRSIMQGDKHIASAQSHNMAKRIARALNAHKVNERGY